MHPAVPVHFPASGTTSHMGLLSNLLLSEVEGKVCLLSSQVSPPSLQGHQRKCESRNTTNTVEIGPGHLGTYLRFACYLLSAKNSSC